MGYSVEVNSKTTRQYEAVSENAHKNFLNFAKYLKFQKLVYLGKDKAEEVYFDTPSHLLNTAGIVLSKFKEGSNNFFKVEKTTFLSNMLNKLNKDVFVHKVGAADKLSDHAFYIKDGITALFSSLSIDLENVITNAVPYMEVTTKAKIYQLISGTGMRAKIALEEKTIVNLETKRKREFTGMSVKLDTKSDVYQNDFEKFLKLIEKNCKDLVPITESQFDYATKSTKPIDPTQKFTKEDLEKIDSKLKTKK